MSTPPLKALTHASRWYLTFKAGDNNTLLIGGNANYPSGAIYEIGVTRDPQGHIVAFAGPAALFSPAPNIDGGLTYGPGEARRLAEEMAVDSRGLIPVIEGILSAV